ncbi:MFS transporter [Nocardioides mangrovicus]|uniref:MFS transporter n=1 Tax=Nocardioides mangrovicus TaxID=2478913 RepID=A0A3L8P3H8_9ACTN|nr:MFS transporter [Nocardioides mangrovicus]RLV49815.1 MFS transporter [Nocardioides mangrovicus]
MTTLTDAPVTGAAVPVAAPQQETASRPWLAFSAVIAAIVLNVLDSTIVNVAAPSVQRDLGMSSASLEWVAAGYTLALAVGLIAAARLGDRVGRRRLFLRGLTGFLATSVLCSAAWSAEVLVGGRVLQGVAAALMVPQCFGLIRDIFGPARMAAPFAALGPVIGLSTILGPVAAGLLMKADLFGSDWRMLFLINLPIGLFSLVVGLGTLPAPAPSHAGSRPDVVGTLLVAMMSFLVVFPLVDGRTLGWPAWVFGVLAAAVPVAGLLAAHQRRRIRAGRSTLIETSLLTKRSYVSGIVFTLFFFGSVIGFSLAIGLFLQVGLGFSALRASLYLAAMAVGAFLGAGVGAWAATAIGRPILHVGLTLMAAGTLVLWVALDHATGEVGVGSLAPGLAVFGLGMGMIFVPLFSIIISEVEDHEVGSASGLLESLQQLGASLGVAVLATLFFDRLELGRPLVAAQDTLLAVVGAIAIAWLLGWLLPRRARAEA